jgi:hypothetical protein
MDFPEQSTRKPRSCENGCGFCTSCDAYLPHETHQNFGRHSTFQNYTLTRPGLRLEFKGYRSDEVVDNTLNYIWTGTVGNHDLQRLQKKAQQRWRDRWFEYAGLKLDARGLSDVRFYFNVFNDYFFCGTLRSTNIQWVDHQSMTEIDWLGETSIVEDDASQAIAYIRLEPGIHDSQSSNVSLGILGTLLHEMVHAMIELYSCSCCCAINSKGVMGHGAAWMRLGQAVEACADKAFPEAGKWDLGVQFTDPSYCREVNRLHELRAFERLHEKTMLWEMKWLHDFCSKGELQNQSA